jgi:hypothetical protein
MTRYRQEARPARHPRSLPMAPAGLAGALRDKPQGPRAPSRFPAPLHARSAGPLAPPVNLESLLVRSFRGPIFSDDGVKRIFHASWDKPRSINQLALQSMVASTVAGRDAIDGVIVTHLLQAHPLYWTPSHRE